MEFLRTLTGQRVLPAPTTSMDASEELIAELDEPPDELRWSKYKAAPAQTNSRRESLLTRQLHSEVEPSDEDEIHHHHTPIPRPPRTFSTHSEWSTHSTTSTAELTSDDGRSVPSPTISPPLAATAMRNTLPITEKPLDRKIAIVQHDTLSTLHPKKDVGLETAIKTPVETSVETGLGRKRCITFACGNKTKPQQPLPPPTSEPEPPVATAAASLPKRKCMLKFVCPSRTESKPTETTMPKRAKSPPPAGRKQSTPSKSPTAKKHRGSDSTVTHGSPKSVRKSPAIPATTLTPIETIEPTTRRLSLGSDESDCEATRFHEFASSDDEPEEWVQESTCHRTRLTISDTLQRETLIRKTCEEVEEEALEDEEDDDEDAEVDVDDQDDDDEFNDDDDDDEEVSEDSDDGFHSDDEDGFAASDSDSEGEDSEYEWWKPGGKSTAATSVEHLDRMTLQHNSEAILASSMGSASSGRVSPRLSKEHFQNMRKARHSQSLKIDVGEPAELPDSTDFVCGTLDEDRPLEQAYIKHMKDREAAKHKARPQDIDPSFPTSDPELDEEDDEDLEDAVDSDNDDLMHGNLDELDGELTLRHRTASRHSRKSTNRRSPPPPTRGRLASPPPPRRRSIYRSPPPPTKRAIARSPAPTKRVVRSPAPVERTARSPAPHNLFGNSPRKVRSPAPHGRFTSPPNTRRTSPAGSPDITTNLPLGLAGRPQPTHTASLPRGGGFLLSRMSTMSAQTSDNEGSDTPGAGSDIPKRGAIDIVKGLERKRQRRKEKLHQKLYAKAAAKGEKPYKVKPGRGAERMREVGLELQRYRGTGQGQAEHILSV